MLVRLREVSLRASTDALRDEDRGLLNSEFMSLRREIERRLSTTRLLAEPLFRSRSSREFQIGTGAGES